VERGLVIARLENPRTARRPPVEEGFSRNGGKERRHSGLWDNGDRAGIMGIEGGGAWFGRYAEYKNVATRIGFHPTRRKPGEGHKNNPGGSQNAGDYVWELPLSMSLQIGAPRYLREIDAPYVIAIIRR